MRNTTKYYPLNVRRTSIVNLAGISKETIDAANKLRAALDAIGVRALEGFIVADRAFRTNLVTSKTNPLTEPIAGTDDIRDSDIKEIRRTAKTASKSSNPIIANAGKEVEAFITPYKAVENEPIASETSTLFHMQIQYDANTALQAAAATLQLTDVFANLFTMNEQVSNLWKERALNEIEKGGPSPSSLRGNLEKSYHDFCDIVLQTVKYQPNPEIETLFSLINEIRIKYSKFLPVKLTDANTMVAPIGIQKYTGKPITPVPPVSIKNEDGEFSELLFTVDFYITYKNNVEIGEAQIMIHGKGKYTGRYTSTFHIEK
jgi:hypothetical protein